MARPRRVWLRNAAERRVRILLAAFAVFAGVLVATVALPALAGSSGSMDLDGSYLQGPTKGHGGDMEWTFWASADTWTGSRQTVVARWQSAESDKAFRLQFTPDGSLQIVARASSGSDLLWSVSQEELGTRNGEGKWFRVRLDRSANGVSKATFWTSDQASGTGYKNLTWGSPAGSDTEPVFTWTSTDAKWTIGAYKTGSSPFKGELKALRVYRGGWSSTGGTKVVDVNFRNAAQASADRKTWTERNGSTWTVKGSSWRYIEPTTSGGGGGGGGGGGNDSGETAPGTPVDDDRNSLILPGWGNNHLRTTARSHGTGDLEFIFRVALDDWTRGSHQAVLSRWSGSGDSGNSVKLQFTGTGELQLVVKKTSGSDQVFTAPFEDFQLQNRKAYWFRVRFDASRNGDSQTRFWASGDSAYTAVRDIDWGAPSVSTQSGTATPRSGNARWEIGAAKYGAVNQLDGQVMFVRAYRNGWMGNGGSKFLDIDLRYPGDGTSTKTYWDTWEDDAWGDWTVYGGAWDYDTNVTAPEPPDNLAPVAAKDNFSMVENSSLTFTNSNLLSNDSDPEGDNLRIDSVATSSNLGGTITKSSGTYTFTPKADVTGTDKFIYVLADDAGNTAIGTVAVAISADASGDYDFTVSPGDDVQRLIDENPGDTSFYFTPGTYRRFSVEPKSGNTFVGANGAVLNGSKVLNEWSYDGSLWYASGQTQGSSDRWEGDSWGRCDSGYDHCVFPEDVFIDGETLWQVGSKSSVGPGRFYFDYGADRIYIAENPSGKKVETSVTTYAFHGNSFNVTIRNFEIKQYANPGRQGVINPRVGRIGQSGGAWNIVNNEIHHNHGWGIKIEHDTVVRNNFIHHNGHGGIGGVADDIRIINNELANNCISGFHCIGWEGGALKINSSTNAVVRGNYVHDNWGHGLHFDIGSRNILFEDNDVRDNEGAGIHFEISTNATIRNNTVIGNGYSRDGSWGHAGIFVLSSKNAEVYGNEVRFNFEGILARQDPRTSPGVYDLYVHDNIVEMRGSERTGMHLDRISDTSFFTSHNNRFRDNDYIIHGSSSTEAFRWHGSHRTPSEWRAAGHDTGGTFTYK